jgi:hypothetical protein
MPTPNENPKVQMPGELRDVPDRFFFFFFSIFFSFPFSLLARDRKGSVEGREGKSEDRVAFVLGPAVPHPDVFFPPDGKAKDIFSQWDFPSKERKRFAEYFSIARDKNTRARGGRCRNEGQFVAVSFST